MLLYAGECFVLEVCGANFVEDVQIVGDIPFLVFKVDAFDFVLH
jgi:hypothetical protein